MYEIELISKAFFGGLTLLEWEWLRDNLEFFSNAVLRAIFAICGRVAMLTYDRDDMLKKLGEFLG